MNNFLKTTTSLSTPKLEIDRKLERVLSPQKHDKYCTCDICLHKEEKNNKNEETHIKFHEFANFFPLLEGKDLQELADDIEQKGQIESIKTLDGKILDGRNRYNACLLKEIEPKFEEIETNKPLDYIISLNIHRRHLNESQRAWIAAEIAVNVQICTQAEAAKMMNVSLRSVANALKAKLQIIPEIKEAVKEGKIAVSLASKIAGCDKEKQNQLIGMSKKEILKTLKMEQLTEYDGTIRNQKITVDFTEDQVKLIEKGMRRHGVQNRSEFIQGIITEHCRNFLPPSKIEYPEFGKRKARHLKKSYSDKDLEVRKCGTSKEEEDMTKEYEYFVSTILKPSLHASVESVDREFQNYLDGKGYSFS